MKPSTTPEGGGAEGAGGMYQLLQIIIDFLDNLETQEFTAAELQLAYENCRTSLSNNLTRLYKAGILERIEFKDKTRRGRKVKYRVRGEMIVFIRNVLYR